MDNVIYCIVSVVVLSVIPEYMEVVINNKEMLYLKVRFYRLKQIISDAKPDLLRRREIIMVSNMALRLLSDL